MSVQAFSSYNIGINKLSSGDEEPRPPRKNKRNRKTTNIGKHSQCANEARNGSVWLKK